METKNKYKYTIFVYVQRVDKPNEGKIIQREYETIDQALKAVKQLGREYVIDKADLCLLNIGTDQIEYKLTFDLSDVITLTHQNHNSELMEQQDKENIKTVLNTDYLKLSGLIYYLKNNYPALLQRITESPEIKNRLKNDITFSKIFNQSING